TPVVGPLEGPVPAIEVFDDAAVLALGGLVAGLPAGTQELFALLARLAPGGTPDLGAVAHLEGRFAELHDGRTLAGALDEAVDEGRLPVEEYERVLQGLG